jgi:hypothetical protein
MSDNMPLVPIESWNGTITRNTREYQAGVETLNLKLEKAKEKVQGNPADAAALATLQGVIQERALHFQTMSMDNKNQYEVCSGIVQKSG